MLSLAGDPLHQKQTVLDAHQGSSGQMLSLTTARGKSGASAVALPPALAMATGCRLWGINAAKIDLRPGEPLVRMRALLWGIGIFSVGCRWLGSNEGSPRFEAF